MIHLIIPHHPITKKAQYQQHKHLCHNILKEYYCYYTRSTLHGMVDKDGGSKNGCVMLQLLNYHYTECRRRRRRRHFRLEVSQYLTKIFLNAFA